MPRHRCVLKVEENCDNINVFISLKPIGNVNGDISVYIAVSLPSTKCMERVCGVSATKQEITF